MEFSRIVYSAKEGEQWRLTCSEFRDVEYIHIRKYYMNMDEEWHPTKDGAAFPLTIASSWTMFLALAELLAGSEVSEVTEGLGDVFKEYEEINSTTIPRDRIRGLLHGSPDNP
jgi:hypothetical protein